MRRLFTIIVSAAIAFLLIFGVQYYFYVEYGDTPDKMANLNPYMPQPIRDWGCRRIAERFPDGAPPGCPHYFGI